jgi:cation diffusion facilitator CzcD-associated flavoprotein CzcO
VRDETRQRRIVIIGSGFGGLGLAIRLKRLGIESFTILEKADRLGGTWRENTYPGAACDVPSILYSFSFEPKSDWSRLWSPQAEIREYMEDCTRRNDVLRHVRFGVEVTGARFAERAGTWTVRTAAGESIEADVLVCAVGQLHHPSIPSLPGLETFQGQWFHSARWNHDCDLAGKRVAVVGNAASAIQFIPEIAKRTAWLGVFQRSANWMVPRLDRAYTAREQWALAHVPGLRRFLRAFAWLSLELWLYPLMRQVRRLQRLHASASTRYMESVVADPPLRAALTPDYPIGGKRILLTDGYYETLQRDDVSLLTAPIERIEADAVVTGDGRRHPADVIILATGFRTNPFLASLTIEGRGGRVLAKDWADGAHAYYGLTVAGYPNFFMLYGLNTNLGHNSIIFMLECQMRYVLSAVRRLEADDLLFLDLKPEVMRRFNERLQAVLCDSAWAAAGPSWYKDASGRITNNWPWSTLWYWWCTRALAVTDYEAVGRAAAEMVGVVRETPVVVRTPAAVSA